MKAADGKQGWFAQLRRDRLLFALTAIFVLVLQLLQPVAHAGSARQAICEANVAESTALGAGHPGSANGCNHCAFCCPPGMADIPRAAVSPAFWFEFPAKARLANLDPERPPLSVSRRPHAIRAPPFSL